MAGGDRGGKNGRLEVVDWFAGRPLTLGSLQLWTLLGAGPLGLRLVEAAAGAAPAWCNEVADEVLYVVVGRGRVGQVPLAPGTALRIPAGTRLRLRTRGTVRAVSVRLPNPGPDPAFVDDDEAETGAATAAHVDDLPREPVDGHFVRRLFSDPIRLEVLTLPPGPHALTTDEAVAVMLSGFGTLGEIAVGTGSCARLPVGSVPFVNEGTAMAHLLVAAAPAL